MWWIIIVAVLIILVIIGVSPSAQMHAGEIDDIVDREFREQKRRNELRAKEIDQQVLKVVYRKRTD